MKYETKAAYMGRLDTCDAFIKGQMALVGPESNVDYDAVNKLFNRAKEVTNMLYGESNPGTVIVNNKLRALEDSITLYKSCEWDTPEDLDDADKGVITKDDITAAFVDSSNSDGIKSMALLHIRTAITELTDAYAIMTHGNKMACHVDAVRQVDVVSKTLQSVIQGIGKLEF